MVGKHAGSIALIKNDPNYTDFLPIHHENLISKYFKYEDIIKTVLEIINFIHKHSKIHKQFRNLLKN